MAYGRRVIRTWAALWRENRTNRESSTLPRCRSATQPRVESNRSPGCERLRKYQENDRDENVGPKVATNLLVIFFDPGDASNLNQTR